MGDKSFDKINKKGKKKDRNSEVLILREKRFIFISHMHRSIHYYTSRVVLHAALLC